MWIASAALFGAPCLATAQQTAAPPGHDIPTPDQLEPGVSTTPGTPAAAAAPSVPVAPGPTVAPPAPAATVAPATGDPTGVAPATPASRATGSTAASATPAERQGATTGKANARKSGPDRLELDATNITGNRELPKVLYIVPWKRSDLGDVVGRPVNSLLDEVLQPLDRDVFQRENRYYDGLKSGAGDAKAGAAQGSPNKP